MSAPQELPMLPMAPPEPAAPEETAPAPDAGAERYRVEGMDCASCAKTVEKAVAAHGRGACRARVVRQRDLGRRG